MKVELEVRAYVVDDYGHRWLLQQVDSDALDRIADGKEETEGMPIYYTVEVEPKVSLFPNLPKP